MKKLIKIVLALALVAAIVISFTACSSGGNDTGGDIQFDSAATLQGILDNFKTDEQYAEYKAMYPNTTFEEKVEGDSILLNISGDEGVSGNYEFKLDGDYLTYTQTDSEDYLGVAFFTYLQSAVSKYLGMEQALVNGYNNGCDVFGIENKYLINETDEATGTDTTKIYVADKYDFKDIDTMYINEKALEYTDALNESHIGGMVSVGKITALYSGSKADLTIVFREYGKRSNLTYQSIINTVAKLQPTGAERFAKYYTELKEGEDDGFKVTFGLSDELQAEYEDFSEEGFEYTVVQFGK